jgi:8-oxo-dGTP pyrophosphatase MutT (NUDIX family)
MVRFDAAGGILVHEDRVLVLRTARYSDLRLPKGHIQDGESPYAAALREVREESGYADLNIVADLGEQIAEYENNGTHTIRNDHYFLLELRGSTQVERPPDDLKFTPEWMEWEQAIVGLAFDEERRWLLAARAALDRTNGGTR